jgi:hypothetical protein
MMSNNTVVYESVFEVAEGEGTVVSGNNRLEVEEASGFPRSYFTQRRTQGPTDESLREVTVEMYTNVAVVSERQGDRDGERVLVLPTGCLFMEGNTAGHLAAVLARYDREAGGKQSFRSFDPLGVATTDVVLEDAGDSTLVLTGEAAPGESRSRSTEHFRYRTAGFPVIDFFVDDEERIIRIDTGPSDLVYTLISHEETPGSTSPVK